MGEKSRRRGNGSIRKVASGRWQVRYTDPFGKRISAGTFGRYSDAERALARVIADIEKGTWRAKPYSDPTGLDMNKIDLAQLSSLWADSRVSRRGQPLSPNTTSEYDRLISKVLTPLSQMQIRAISSRDIDVWWARESRRAPAQAAKAYTYLSGLMRWAVKRKWIPENPCDVFGASAYRPAQEPEIPRSEDVDFMIAVSDEPMSIIISLAAYGGLRKGEILELRGDDFEYKSLEGQDWMQVRVERAVIWDGENSPIVRLPKSRAGVRDVLLPQKVGQLVEAYLSNNKIVGSDLLFARDDLRRAHWGESMLNPRWRKIRSLAGYKGRFHSLRAFHLTQYAIAGATTKELMERGGHRDVATAMKYQRNVGREATLVGLLR